MNESILCLVALGFLAWVFILKAENAAWKAQNQKLCAQLERFVKKTTGDVDVVAGSRSWGKVKDAKA